MANDMGDATELIEINLMFAQLDLSLGKHEDGATARALHHIREALRHLRAEIAHTPGRCDPPKPNAGAPPTTRGGPSG